MIQYNNLHISINLIIVFITFKVAEFVNLIVIYIVSNKNKIILQYGAKIQSGRECICTIPTGRHRSK